MPDEDGTKDLVEALGRRMTERLAGQGWAVYGRTTGRAHRFPTIGAFSRPLGNGFSAIVIFPSQAKELRPVEDELPPAQVGHTFHAWGLVAVGRVCVGYEPAEALVSACTGSKVSGIALNAPTISATACVASELPEAENQLARFAAEHAVSVAQRYTDADVFIEALRDHSAVPFTGEAEPWYASAGIEPDATEGPLESVEAEFVPALLATAGRHDEARTALAEYISSDRENIDRREYRRFARQLTRWLDADGELPPPTTPERWPPPSSVKWTPRATPNFAEFFEHARADSQARKEALAAVRAASHDKSRDQVRALLEREFSERGLTTEPLTVERELELILAEREPLGKVRFAVRMLKQLKDSEAFTGGGLLEHAAGISDRPPEPPGEPDWLQPPDRAAYPVSSPGPKWTRVELYPAAVNWLERIKESDPSGVAGGREVEVWLTWDGGQPAAGSRLAVHIGAEPVGVLGAGVEDQFRPAMEAAAERDEDPFTRGRLSTISGPMPYLLEVELPASAPGDDPTGGEAADQ